MPFFERQQLKDLFEQQEATRSEFIEDMAASGFIFIGREDKPTTKTDKELEHFKNSLRDRYGENIGTFRKHENLHLNFDIEVVNFTDPTSGSEEFLIFARSARKNHPKTEEEG